MWPSCGRWALLAVAIVLCGTLVMKVQGQPLSAPIPDATSTTDLPPPRPADTDPNVPMAQCPPASDQCPSPLPMAEEQPSPLPDAFSSRMGGFRAFDNPVVGHLPITVDYRIMWLPSEPVRAQPTDLEMERATFAVRTPIWQDSQNEFSFTTHLRSDFIQTDAVFPSGQPLPQELWDIGIGGMYRHLFDNGWIAGVSVEVGSASNRPFAGWDEMTLELSTFLRVPQGEHNAWLFSLSYSPTAQIPFPIPGVAYSWVPSDQLRVNFGLPFQVTYRPLSDWTFDFSYMLLTNVHARVTYRCWGPIRIYAGYDWENEGYLPADRPDSKDRLFSSSRFGCCHAWASGPEWAEAVGRVRPLRGRPARSLTRPEMIPEDLSISVGFPSLH